MTRDDLNAIRAAYKWSFDYTTYSCDRESRRKMVEEWDLQSQPVAPSRLPEHIVARLDGLEREIVSVLDELYRIGAVARARVLGPTLSAVQQARWQLINDCGSWAHQSDFDGNPLLSMWPNPYREDSPDDSHDAR